MESSGKKQNSDERYPVPGPERAPVKSLMPPINFKKWIDENRDKLKPPTGVYLVYDFSEDYIIMVVGGPNKRSDYHINQSEEFFYQLEGNMLLKVVVDGHHQDVPIEEGCIFLLPANTPHSPQRFPNTVGLVIERRRTSDLTDRVRWYCDACHEHLWEQQLPLRTLQIGQALTPVINQFYSDEQLRTCKKCGHVSQVPK